MSHDAGDDLGLRRRVRLSIVAKARRRGSLDRLVPQPIVGGLVEAHPVPEQQVHPFPFASCGADMDVAGSAPGPEHPVGLALEVLAHLQDEPGGDQGGKVGVVGRVGHRHVDVDDRLRRHPGHRRGADVVDAQRSRSERPPDRRPVTQEAAVPGRIGLRDHDRVCHRNEVTPRPVSGFPLSP
jgi:hypothetical protein